MATILYTSGLKEEVTFKSSDNLLELQKIVGGYIEAIPLSDSKYMIINEEGKLKDLPLNVQATEQTRGILANHDVIAGVAVVVTAPSEFN